MTEEAEWLARAKEATRPYHVGLIMDGNGRWAKRRGLPRRAGHKAGVETLRKVLPAFIEVGIPCCSLFVFSTENWRRPKDEVDFLFRLILEWTNKSKELIDQGIRFVPVGRWRDLPAPVPAAIAHVAKVTEKGGNLTAYGCINYGGQQEILDAAKAMTKACAGDARRAEDLDLEVFRRFLYVPDMPELDLVVRTSGEKRLSNFLLWQASYSELVFTDVLWPDMTPTDIYKAVVEYGSRKRRFGDIDPKGG